MSSFLLIFLCSSYFHQSFFCTSPTKRNTDNIWKYYVEQSVREGMWISVPVLGGRHLQAFVKSYHGFMATTKCFLDSPHTPDSAKATMCSARHLKTYNTMWGLRVSTWHYSSVFNQTCPNMLDEQSCPA